MKLRQSVATLLARLQPPRTAVIISFLLNAVTIWLTIRVFLVFNDPLLHGPLESDESHFVWGGWCITKGLVPYRDFMEFKPPFVFLTHALALKLYDFHEFGYRHFFTYFPLASLVALQIALLSRRADRWLTLGVVLGLIHLWVNRALHDVALTDSESIGLTYYWFGTAFLLLRSPYKDLTNAIGGAFLVVSALSKEPLLPVAILTMVACFLVRESSSNVARDIKRYLKFTAIGGGVVVVALGIYMAESGALIPYIKMMRVYYRYYQDNALSYCVVLGRFHPTTRTNDLWRQFEKARREFLNRQILGYMLPLGIGALLFTARRSLALLATTLLAGFFAFYAVTTSNCQWVHYYNMTISGIFFFVLIGIDSMTPYLRSSDWTMRTFVQFSMLATVWLVVRPRFLEERELYGTRVFQNEYLEPVPGEFEAVNKYTSVDDRIFTTGMPTLYIQTNRISALRESAMLDEALMGYYEGNTDTEKMSSLRAQLEAHMPKIVVLDPADAMRKVRINAALLLPFLGAHHYLQLTPNIWRRPD